jgi:hypothetical protein
MMREGMEGRRGYHLCGIDRFYDLSLTLIEDNKDESHGPRGAFFTHPPRPEHEHTTSPTEIDGGGRIGEAG